MEFKCEGAGFGLPGSRLATFRASRSLCQLMLVPHCLQSLDAYKPWGTSTAAERPACAQKVEM